MVLSSTINFEGHGCVEGHGDGGNGRESDGVVSLLANYERHPAACVLGSNLRKMRNLPSPEACGVICDLVDRCLGFEFYHNYGGPSRKFRRGDCVLQNSVDMEGCRGWYANLDFYMKIVPGWKHEPCPAGQRWDMESDVCLPCAAGTYNHGKMHYTSTTCYVVPSVGVPYTYRSPTEVECRPGWVAPLGITYNRGEYEAGCEVDHRQCLAGTYWQDEEERCLPCPSGKYNHGGAIPGSTCFFIVDREITYCNRTAVICSQGWVGVPEYDDGEYESGCVDGPPPDLPTMGPTTQSPSSLPTLPPTVATSSPSMPTWQPVTLQPTPVTGAHCFNYVDPAADDICIENCQRQVILHPDICRWHCLPLPVARSTLTNEGWPCMSSRETAQCTNACGCGGAPGDSRWCCPAKEDGVCWNNTCYVACSKNRTAYGYRLVRSSAECPGGNTSYQATLPIDECRALCSERAGLFVFGIHDTAECETNGVHVCRCRCETGVPPGVAVCPDWVPSSTFNLYAIVGDAVPPDTAVPTHAPVSHGQSILPPHKQSATGTRPYSVGLISLFVFLGCGSVALLWRLFSYFRTGRCRRLRYGFRARGGRSMVLESRDEEGLELQVHDSLAHDANQVSDPPDIRIGVPIGIHRPRPLPMHQTER